MLADAWSLSDELLHVSFIRVISRGHKTRGGRTDSAQSDDLARGKEGRMNTVRLRLKEGRMNTVHVPDKWTLPKEA